MKKTINKFKLFFITALMFVASLCLFLGFSNMNQLTVNATISQTVTISMANGGEIRCESEPLGLGFRTYIKASEYDALVGVYGEENVTTGTIFVRQSDAKGKNVTLDNTTFTKANLTSKSVTFADVVNNGFMNNGVANSDGNYEYRGSVTGIKPVNAEKEYCARSYIQVNTAELGEPVYEYIYADYNAEYHKRSIQAVADAAASDTKPSAEGAYINEVKTGVFSKYSLAQYTAFSAYTHSAVRAFEKTVFTADDTTDQDYLYQYNKATFSNTQVIDNDGLETAGMTLNGYTGSALQLPMSRSTNYMFLRLPTAYKESAKTDYVKLGVWFAVSRVADYTWNGGQPIFIKNTNSLVVADKAGNQTVGTDFDYNKFYYTEVTIDALDSYWQEGYINLWQIWVDKSSTLQDSVFVNEHKLYLGDVTFMTQAEVDAREEAREEAEKELKVQILNGLTSENYTQYTKAGAVGQFKSAADINNEYTVSGAYSGNAVAFESYTQQNFSVDFPVGELPTTGNFYVWVAMIPKTGYTPASDELWQPNADTTNAIFGFNWTNCYRFSTTYMTFNKWHLLSVPVTDVTAKLSAAEELLLFNAYAKNWNVSNYTLLVGDIGVTTTSWEDKILDTTDMPLVLSENMVTGNATIKPVHYSLAEVSALGFTNTVGYNGGAISLTQANGAKMYVKLSTADYAKYTDKTNYSYVRIYWAVGGEDINKFGNANNANSALLPKQTGTQLNTWYCSDVALDTLISSTAYDATNQKLCIADLWNNGTNPATLYIGNIEVISAS